MKKRFIITMIFVLSLVLVLGACSQNKDNEKENDNKQEEKGEMKKEEGDDSKTEEKESNEEQKSEEDKKTEKGDEMVDKEKNMANPVVIISTKKGEEALKDMKIELYPNKAPNTVANFVTLANEGFYDGKTFHRIIESFMIQGGDPKGTGEGGPGYGIKGEFKSNGFENDIKHEKGVISMARAENPDSAGSQFFICHGDATFLDGEYAAFGKLIEGEEALDALATVKTNEADKPEEACVITKITVELNGYEIPEVEKIKE